jgi:salicylate hydroxylase
VTKINVAICGCGPAGLAAALLLHREGHRVTVIERFAEAQPVGSGLILQPTGLGVLAELGLVDEVIQLGERIDRLLGRVVPSNRVVLDVQYSALGNGWHGVAVHRSVLFDVLFKAAKHAGIEFVLDVQVTGVDVNQQAHLMDKHGRRVGSFDLVVDAMGTNSPLAAQHAKRSILDYGALWTNIPLADSTTVQRNMLEQRYRKASHMAGVLPIGRLAHSGIPLAVFFWSIKRHQYQQWREAGLNAWREQVRALWPMAATLLEAITDKSQVVFAQYDHFTLKQPHSNRLVHIGDAAHATSPQLGQGANMALLDALALARAVQSSESISKALESYAHMRRWHVRLFQRASAMFTPFYQSDSAALPLLRDWLAAPMSRMPVADRMLAKLVSGLTVAPLAGAQFHPYRLS